MAPEPKPGRLDILPSLDSGPALAQARVFARMTEREPVILDSIQDPVMAPWLQQGHLDMCTHWILALPWILAFARMTGRVRRKPGSSPE